MLTLEPDRGTCNTHVTVRGSGFPPGKQISIGAWPIVPYYEDVGYGLENGTVVEVDSTFTVEITPLNFGCRSGSLQLVISAGVWPRDGVSPAVSARYTISSAPAPFPKWAVPRGPRDPHGGIRHAYPRDQSTGGHARLRQPDPGGCAGRLLLASGLVGGRRRLR